MATNFSQCIQTYENSWSRVMTETKQCGAWSGLVLKTKSHYKLKSVSEPNLYFAIRINLGQNEDFFKSASINS